MPFPKVKSHEPGNLLQLRGLAGCSRAAASRQRFHKAMTFQEAKSHLGLSKTPSRELGRDLASPELVVGRSRPQPAPVLASRNKCLAQSNKSPDGNNATKKRDSRGDRRDVASMVGNHNAKPAASTRSLGPRNC